MRPLHVGTLLIGLLMQAFALLPAAHAELSAEELAKLAQNPIANMVTIPLQNNTNFDYGGKTQNVLNFQPVIPIELNADWNIITRTVAPLIWQPALTPGGNNVFGLGDIQLSAFLSPSNASSGLIWGVGAIAQLPTHTGAEIGNDNWGLGPTAVVLKMEEGSPWVYGVLVNNVWSLDSSTQPSYSNFLLQPFVNYNLRDGTYINSVPMITANWKASGGNQWTVPLGVGVGHIFRLGTLPLDAQIGAYYNVVKPDFGPTWQLRLQAQILFPN